MRILKMNYKIFKQAIDNLGLQTVGHFVFFTDKDLKAIKKEYKRLMKN